MKIKIVNPTFIDRKPIGVDEVINVDNALAATLIANGKATDDFEDGEPTGLDAMGVKELKSYAAENDIDLEGATKKDDIRAVIDAALEEDDDEE